MLLRELCYGSDMEIELIKMLVVVRRYMPTRFSLSFVTVRCVGY